MRIEFGQVVTTRDEQAKIEQASGMPIAALGDKVVLKERDRCTKLACGLIAYSKYEGPVSGETVRSSQLELKFTSLCPLDDDCPSRSIIGEFRQALLEDLTTYAPVDMPE
jgi:hypothetical protein